jgi:hypothetical protein
MVFKSMEEDEDISIIQEKSPFFNFAEASLKRIDAVLYQWGMVSVNSEMSEVLKQQKKISLIKLLLQYAIPLAPELFVSNFVNEILNLELERIIKVKTGTEKVICIFSKRLDRRLDEIFMEITLKLQRKGYFMPGKDETSMF